jgi:hypothetical protein
LRPLQRRLAALALVALALAIGSVRPQAGLAFPLSGCHLTITSLDAGGAAIDSAIGGGADATQAAPLQVSWDGTIEWSGSSGAQAIRGAGWHVDVFGLPTSLRGDDPNQDGGTSAAESIRISEAVPFQFTGLFYVSGQLSGEGGTCTGEGWVRVLGDPMSTLPFLVSLALVLVGAVLLAVGARGRWLPAVAGGLLLGQGTVLLLVIYGFLPLAAATPPIVIALGLLIGIGAGWVGRVRLRRAERGTAG